MLHLKSSHAEHICIVRLHWQRYDEPNLRIEALHEIATKLASSVGILTHRWAVRALHNSEGSPRDGPSIEFQRPSRDCLTDAKKLQMHSLIEARRRSTRLRDLYPLNAIEGRPVEAPRRGALGSTFQSKRNEKLKKLKQFHPSEEAQRGGGPSLSDGRWRRSR